MTNGTARILRKSKPVITSPNKPTANPKYEEKYENVFSLKDKSRNLELAYALGLFC